MPRKLEGFEYLQRQILLTLREMASEIDNIFYHYGLAEYLPPTARYLTVIALCFTPVMLLLLLLFCCDDGYTPV